jgi:hypothetical protein
VPFVFSWLIVFSPKLAESDGHKLTLTRRETN